MNTENVETVNAENLNEQNRKLRNSNNAKLWIIATLLVVLVTGVVLSLLYVNKNNKIEVERETTQAENEFSRSVTVLNNYQDIMSNSKKVLEFSGDTEGFVSEDTKELSTIVMDSESFAVQMVEDWSELKYDDDTNKYVFEISGSYSHETINKLKSENDYLNDQNTKMNNFNVSIMSQLETFLSDEIKTYKEETEKRKAAEQKEAEETKKRQVEQEEKIKNDESYRKAAQESYSNYDTEYVIASQKVSEARSMISQNTSGDIGDLNNSVTELESLLFNNPIELVVDLEEVDKRTEQVKQLTQKVENEMRELSGDLGGNTTEENS